MSHPLRSIGTCVSVFNACYSFTQVPASLEFVYVTDHGRTALHYIASGIHHRHPHLGELYTSEDVTCSSPHDVQRAELLSFLIEEGHFPITMDWNTADAGCALRCVPKCRSGA